MNLPPTRTVHYLNLNNTSTLRLDDIFTIVLGDELFSNLENASITDLDDESHNSAGFFYDVTNIGTGNRSNVLT